MTIPSKQSINKFLSEFKATAQKKHGFTFVKRKDNLDFLADSGIILNQVKDIILGITDGQYYSGPEKDRDRSGQNIWVFHVNVNNTDVYVKLSDGFTKGKAKCISFHKAKYKMKKRK